MTDIELLARLVGFDTTSRLPNRPLNDFLCEYLGAAPRCERFEGGDNGENMLISLGPDCVAGEGLLLCGHVDTVPAEESDWTASPRTLVERDGRLVARGACDMKGFVALAANLMRERSAASLEQPLQLLVTCNEEIGTIGAANFVRAWPRARALPKRCLVGEPTSMRVVRGHKGHLSITICVRGVAAHSGFPHKGANAIEFAGNVIAALSVLRKTLAQQRNAESSLFPEVPFPVLTMARIRGGRAINIIPDRCEIDVGVRLLPGMSSDDAVALVRATVEAVVPHEAVTVTLLNDTPAFATPADDPWHRELCDLVGQRDECGVGFGTDAGRLALLGLAPVIWGPGDISNAHRANEWMPREEFDRAAVLLRQLVR